MRYAVKAIDKPDMQPIGYFANYDRAAVLCGTINNCHESRRYEVVIVREKE